MAEMHEGSPGRTVYLRTQYRELHSSRPAKHLKSLKNGTVEVGRGLFCDVEQSIMGENRSVCRESVGLGYV